MAADPTYIADPYTPTEMFMEHRDGVDWFHAVRPRRWHRCSPQTRGCDGGYRVERCACGAMRVNGSRWMEKNSRRRDR